MVHFPPRSFLRHADLTSAPPVAAIWNKLTWKMECTIKNIFGRTKEAQNMNFIRGEL